MFETESSGQWMASERSERITDDISHFEPKKGARGSDDEYTSDVFQPAAAPAASTLTDLSRNARGNVNPERLSEGCV